MNKKSRLWMVVPCVLMLLMACSKEDQCLFDEHGQIEPLREKVYLTILINDAPGILITIENLDSLLAPQTKQDSVVATVMNISGRRFDRLEVSYNLYSVIDHLPSNHLFHKTINYFDLANGEIIARHKLFERTAPANQILQTAEAFWEISIQEIPANEPANTIVGDYTGEIFLFGTTGSTPLHFSRVRGNISSARDLQLTIIDQVTIALQDDSEVTIETIDGVISSFGDFWGKIQTDSSLFYDLRASGIPTDTTDSGTLEFSFELPIPAGVDSIDSIACTLIKN